MALSFVIVAPAAVFDLSSMWMTEKRFISLGPERKTGDVLGT
jgi:hypothetical protein